MKRMRINSMIISFQRKTAENQRKKRYEVSFEVKSNVS